MVVNHTASLRLDSDPPLPLHVQLVQDLFVAPRCNGPRELQQSIAERALPMINMCHYAEIAESFNWDCLYSAFKFRDGLRSLSASCNRGGEGARLREQSRSILASDGAREPQKLQWTSLHL